MIALSVFAIGCIIIFRGHTESLIPLYAIGVFIPFTLALISLAIHHAYSRRMIIPTIAAALTSIVVVTLIIMKPLFISPVLLFVPTIIFLCNKIKQHYEQVQAQLIADQTTANYNGQLIVLPISGLHASTKKAIQIAQLQYEAQLVVLFIGTTKAEAYQLQTEWNEQFPNIRLIAFASSKQQLLQPLLRVIGKLKYIAKLNKQHITICIPQLVVHKQWQNILHNHHAFLLKQALLKDPQISVLCISYKIDS